MMRWLHPPAAERRILGGGGLRSVTPWIVAAMSFSILIVVACCLLLAHAAGSLSASIDRRYALEVPNGGRDLGTITARLRSLPQVAAADPVSDAEMRATLERWIGPAAQSRDLPVPALINFDLRPGAEPQAVQREMRAVSPNARMIAHGETLAPLHRSLTQLKWIAAVLALMLGGAAAAAVVLAARASMDTHRATIDVLHGIGATDRQVTGLFQRRIAVDSFVGAASGGLAAGIVMLVVAGGARWAADMGGIVLGPLDIVILLLLPVAISIVATLVARAAILSTLGRQL